jgi:hypothetical protein
MMDADFKFDLTRSGWAVIEGSVLDAKVSDIILDSPARRGPDGGPFRRALVHDQSDGLTVNFNGDYPGGVRINNVSLNLKVLHQSGGSPVLPKEGSPGDILMIVNTTMIEHTPVGVNTSLWLCVPASTIAVALGATWQQIQLGSTVHGTG